MIHLSWGLVGGVRLGRCLYGTKSLNRPTFDWRLFDSQTFDWFYYFSSFIISETSIEWFRIDQKSETILSPKRPRGFWLIVEWSTDAVPFALGTTSIDRSTINRHPLDLFRLKIVSDFRSIQNHSINVSLMKKQRKIIKSIKSQEIKWTSIKRRTIQGCSTMVCIDVEYCRSVWGGTSWKENRGQSYKTFYTSGGCKIKCLNCRFNEKGKCNLKNMLGCSVLTLWRTKVCRIALFTCFRTRL